MNKQIKTKSIKKPNPDSRSYKAKANQLARDFCPPIYPCKDCDEPVISRYCCTFCDSTDP